MTLLDRIHTPNAPGPGPAQRPQETRMTQDRIIITLDRQTAGEWTAQAARGNVTVRRHGSLLHEDERVDRVGESPADVLELVGRELDEREASRLSRETAAERAGQPAGPFTVEDAVEAALIRDVRNVVAVLEREATLRGGIGVTLRTSAIAHLSGIIREAGGNRDEALARTIRALRRAESDGVVVDVARDAGRGIGDGAWTLAGETDEEASR